MEAAEFFQCYNKMCNSHVSDCVGCEAQRIDCELTTDEPEKLVAAVERWAKAHPEEAADVTKPKQDEPCVKTIQDQLEGAIYREIISHKTKIEKLEHDVSVMRNNLAELKDKTYKEQQVEVKKEQSCGNNALEERVDHLEKCCDEMNERLPASSMTRLMKCRQSKNTPNIKTNSCRQSVYTWIRRKLNP